MRKRFSSFPFSVRRGVLKTVLLTGLFAVTGSASQAFASESDEYAAIRAAAEKGKAASIARLKEWIALPSIAAEDLNMPEGAEYMRKLALDAGFETAENAGDLLYV